MSVYMFRWVSGTMGFTSQVNHAAHDANASVPYGTWWSISLHGVKQSQLTMKQYMPSYDDITIHMHVTPISLNNVYVTA